MAKAKKQRSSWNFELKNIVAGWLLFFLSVLTFFADRSSVVGAYLIEGLTYLLGDHSTWIFVPMVGVLSVLIIVNRLSWNSARVLGLLLYFLSVVSLVAVWQPYGNHGLFDISESLIAWFGRAPALLALVGWVLISMYLTLRLSYRKIIGKISERLPNASDMRETISSIRKESREDAKERKSDEVRRQKALDMEVKLEAAKLAREAERKLETRQLKLVDAPQHIAIEKKEKGGLLGGFFSKGEDEKGKVQPSEKNARTNPDFGAWTLPPTNLLEELPHLSVVSRAEIEEKSLLIEHTLDQFRIGVSMVGERVGPTVVQYRLKPDDGVKLSKIENLKKDLTLALKAKSIRIQAPIPGLGLVGVEVPNDKRDTIGIREVIEHPNFKNAKSNLAVAIGKDINGDYIVGDLAKMPHVLIAGQTGSGKSVGMNGFLLSLLYRNAPSDLRLILIDPKRVELGIYNGIPHLLTPVINEPDKALNALKWSVTEMIARYDRLHTSKVRNLAEYNAKVLKKDRMPNIVIVIDELADLMMSGNKKEVETTIARIAQMARAVGMHLIVATQRPSVDVITGLIKANIPSRIAFTVASLTDSRTILDRMGAEDLLGNGDMLYSPSGSMAPERIQGVFVSTEEVESVVNFIKRTIDPAMLEDIYDVSIVEGDRGNFEGSIAGGGDYDEDPKVIDEAIAFVRSAGKASTSMLQRRMKLGYARAARVMDILEEMGVVGPADGSKPREVIG